MIKRTIKKIFPVKFSSEQVDKTTELVSGNQHKFFFVHIPKTAGTSFRTSFEINGFIYKDYGGNSKGSSDEIKRHVYEAGDLYEFKKRFNNHKSLWITGHINLAKYIDFVPVSHTITFVREPLQQVLSHYNHYVRYHGFTGDFSAFLDKPYAKNLQSHYLKFMPIGLIGCLGITEHYDQSLALINQQFDLNLLSQKVNINDSKHFTNDTLTSELNDKFVKNNLQDITMYKEALFLHTQRIDLAENNKVWTYGSVGINSNNVLHGCAFQYKSEDPISLVIFINHEPFKTITATNFYTGYPKANFPRGRYIGFHVPLPKYVSKDDEVDVYVEETGQKLNFKTLRTKK